jgi:hypothetical protein
MLKVLGATVVMFGALSANAGLVLAEAIQDQKAVGGLVLAEAIQDQKAVGGLVLAEAVQDQKTVATDSVSTQSQVIDLNVGFD